MTKLSERELARLLARRHGVEPPADLAKKIKAEIPDLAAVGGAGVEPEGVAGMPPREAGYRPFLLLAATLLVVIGVGFIAAHLLEPPGDLAREVALGGVPVIDDIVVTVPPRAPAGPGAPPHSGNAGADASSAAAGSDRPLIGPGSETVTVVVRRADGAPCRGITVELQRTDVTPRWHSHTETDGAGVARFVAVPAGTYTLSAGRAGARPARLEMFQVAPKAATQIDLRLAPSPRPALPS